MIREFALEPELVATWGSPANYRFFYDKFGVGSPRVVAEYPGRREWNEVVHRSLASSSPADGLRVVELVRRITERMTLRPFPYEQARDWLENAESEHALRPFHLVLARHNPRSCRSVRCGDSLGAASDPDWDLSTSTSARREAHHLASAVSGMLRLADTIVLVDPHFGPENERHRDTLLEFCRSITRGRHGPMPTRVEVQTSEKSTASFFVSECKTRLPSLIPTGLVVRFRRWVEREPGQKLHGRYILTELGGILFGTGLDRAKSKANQMHETEDLLLMGQELFRQHWHEYAGPSPAFDEAEPRPPIEVIGTRR